MLRWRDSAATVVRRVQGAFVRGSPDDVDEIFQDAVGKFLSRGLDQLRGVSEQVPGKAASPKTFFLRIVKHCAIDRYRRQREELDAGPADGEEDDAREPAHESARAVTEAGAKESAKEAKEEYWVAYARLKEEHPNEAAAWDLYHHQDMDDHTEVARVLGITVVNWYKRVCARRRTSSSTCSRRARKRACPKSRGAIQMTERRASLRLNRRSA